ncbi:MAG: arginine-tRNA-protein transferase [Bacteroidota bacterium]
MPGPQLDEYLAQGWFRMGQSIFTTDFIPVNMTVHPVFWLRFVLPKVQYKKKQQRLLLANKNLAVVIKPFLLSEEVEDLYAIYRATVDFDAPPTVESFLLDGAINSIYDTQLIEIRDAGRLIAAGIFDNGSTAIAGIMNFYDPAYKAKSLGKYLMLLKINYAIESGKQYYYPGYIAGGFAKFDYKLFPGEAAAEIYDANKAEWIPVAGVTLPGGIGIDMIDDGTGNG